MKEMITVEKEVYEAVLRNSVRVNDLEVENQQLKELLKECLDVFSNHVSPFYSYCQWQKYPCVDTEDFYQDTKAVCKIIDKIDNAIGEKK